MAAFVFERRLLLGMLGGEQGALQVQRALQAFPGAFAKERLALLAVALGELAFLLLALGLECRPGRVARPLRGVLRPARHRRR